LLGTSRDDFTGICEQNRIVPVFLPLHTSNQLQPLDLCIFGVTQKAIRLHQVEDWKIQAQYICLILEEFVQAATPMNIVSAFRNAGIDRVLEKMAGPVGELIWEALCRVSPETCRCLLTNAFDTEEIVAAAMNEEDNSEFEPEEEANEDDEDSIAELMV
jgi:hypothetical protein